MTWTPPGVSIQSLAPGTHQVVLTKLQQVDDPAKLAKFGAQAVFIATWKSVENAIEIDHVIKFTGSKADYYAGLNIERMCAAAGLPDPTPGEPLNVDALAAELEAVSLLLEVNEKGYAQTILIPHAATGTGEGVPF